MRNVRADTPLSIRVDFIGPDGSSLPASDASISFRLDNSAGELVPTTPVSFPNGSQPTGVTVNLTAVQNPAPTGGRILDTRRLTVVMSSGGVQYRFEKVFRVIVLPWLSFGPSEVRAFLGLSQDELPDDEVDVVGTYLRLKTPELDAALGSGTKNELAANDQLMFQCVLDTIPSCQMRLRAAVQDGALTIERLRTIDFDMLLREAQRKLEESKRTLTPNAELQPALFISLTTQADRFTGG